jgi:hypothetical protein
MPRNERSEDAFVSPAVETCAYRYTWHCTYSTVLSEGDENGVALGIGSSNLSTSSLSQWYHCESKVNQGRHSLNIDLTLLLKRQEAPRRLPIACESWMMTRQKNNVLVTCQHLGLVETLIIKEGNRVEERPKRLAIWCLWILQSRRTASKLSTQCCQLPYKHTNTSYWRGLGYFYV